MPKPATVDAIFFDAHADDIELACGGTIATLVKSGRRVAIVDLTRGEMGTRGTPETRLRESRAAAKTLGAAFREQLNFGDRKSTRLNSSHRTISYAVFCLKKKTI